MKTKKYVLLLVIAATLSCFLVSCASIRYPSMGSVPLRQMQEIAMTPVIFLQDLGFEKKPDLDLQNFETNLFLGEIFFKGGIITDHDRGDITRAKERVFSQQDAYRRLAAKWLNTALRDAYGSRLQPLGQSVDAKLDLSFDVRMVALKAEEIGNDNYNIPLEDYRITQISAAYLAKLGMLKSKYVVLPLVDCWYSHSAGWFNDQAYGCGAGIRATVQVVVVDAISGTVAFREKIDLKFIDDYESHLSVNVIQRNFEELRRKLITRLQGLF